MSVSVCALVTAMYSFLYAVLLDAKIYNLRWFYFDSIWLFIFNRAYFESKENISMGTNEEEAVRL